MINKFVHLRLHSEYSISDGILKIDEIIEFVNNDMMIAVALTDLNNMFGLIRFYKQCKIKGVKPIIGAEVNIVGVNNLEYKVIILVKNINGYRQLCELITNSYVQSDIGVVSKIKEEILLTNVWHDLIVLSGGCLGDIGNFIINDMIDKAKDKVAKWMKSFPDSYYLEIHRTNNINSNLLIKQSIDLSRELSCPLVASHPIQFMAKGDFEAHEVKVCITAGEKIFDESRVIKFSIDQYFKSQQEMLELFKDIPSSIENTVEIAKRCNLDIPLNQYFLPTFITPNDTTLQNYLITLAQNGLDKKLSMIFSDVDLNLHKDKYHERLQTEINMINQMEFTGYFLIVADFINWAKNNNISVGPGRGSGAGSLVAFALDITDVDPIKYNLLFERFLNPERVSMPDFDIDFCQERRELVIDYVKKKYGNSAVSQIATFGTLSSKAVIKDVGRVLGIPYNKCDFISKLIKNTQKKVYSLLEAYDEFTDLKKIIDNGDDEIVKLWELSLRLENLIRNVGKHAAGVLIAPRKLTDFCPLYLAENMLISQFDKDDVEQIGLVKFDFLGLRNLTIIRETIESIKNLYGVDVLLSRYNFDDENTFELIRSGNTAAVFQLESDGMRRTLIKLKPDNFEEIIALIALYRPGPLGSGMVDDFIKRKNKEQQVNYFDNSLKECLLPTYGVIVYQEQVMQISQIIGGYSLGEADLLRRAMGKKKPEEMEKHKSMFVNGAVKNGYKQQLAQELFELMSKFAEYGFNKSHSAAYAVISYHTAYLKANYISSFMASTLSSELSDTDKLNKLNQDCLANGITMLPPDVNLSTYKFTPIDNNSIRYGLGAVKGVGEVAVNKIINERKNGLFTSFIDFMIRCFDKEVNKKTVEGLIKSGAFDKLDSNRFKLLANFNRIIVYVEKEIENRSFPSLFDDPVDLINNFNYDEVNEGTIKDKLLLEKEAIGYYFSEHIYDEFKTIVDKLNIKSLSNYTLESEYIQKTILIKPREKLTAIICGVVNSVTSSVKKGEKNYRVDIIDKLGSAKFFLSEKDFLQYNNIIVQDEFVFVEADLSYNLFNDEIKYNPKKVYTINEFLKHNLQEVILQIDDKFNIDNLDCMLGNEGVPIVVDYVNEYCMCKVKLGENFKLTLNYHNFNTLSKILGDNNWKVKLY